MTQHSDIQVEKMKHVAIVEIRRPPHNYFDSSVIKLLADEFASLDAEAACRCIVLASEGRNFCAGAMFQPSSKALSKVKPEEIYTHALRLFKRRKPVVAAVQGAAIGGGLGLALAADFRIATVVSGFSANFARLGLHPGFGLSVTLPRAIGIQNASRLLLTGCRIDGQEAYRLGLVDVLAPDERLRQSAIELATEIAAGAPLALDAIRSTMTAGLVEKVDLALKHELAEQKRLAMTADFIEGLKSVKERRSPRFRGE